MKNWRVINSLFSVVTIFCLSYSLSLAAETPNRAIRATLDIGSGATKLRVAEVDLQTKKITRILESKSYAVPYQEQLSQAKDNNFDRQVMDQGLQALQDASLIAKKYNVEKVIAVATAAFRKANNAQDYIDEIAQKTGITVHVIDQTLEGELAFQAVRAQFGYDPEKLVVWDIGGGSIQLTTMNGKGEYEIYQGHIASVPFKNHVISQIQKKDPLAVSTPNPISAEELLRAQSHAIKISRDVDALFKEKMQDPSVEIVGVGNIFGYHISKIGTGDSVNIEQMLKATSTLIDKSDSDVGGGDFANVYVTNTLLVLGFMEGLNISELNVADINPADGAFFYEPFWRTGSSVSSDATNQTNVNVDMQNKARISAEGRGMREIREAQFPRNVQIQECYGE
ncbi:MAG: hypothetical protein H0W50_11395 [Parachlamydiaceae bacterium]|nr:hypothetical protein [Parachlamydiaceae bacterium]